MSYADVAKRGKLIASITAARIMPPWKAEPASYAYKDSRRLNDNDLKTIQKWVKQGMPEGNATRAVALPKFTDGWQLGTPDLVVKMDKAFTVPAEGVDIYRYLRIPVDLPDDKWVRAIELRPSSRQVVHHVLYCADSVADAKKIEAEQDADKSSTAGMKFTRDMAPLGGVAVGAQPHLLPDGLALKLPKGAGVQLPVAYGLFSALNIAPGDRDFTARDSFVLPVDVEAVSVGAHAHYIGKTMKLTATFPDGAVKTLLDIKDWDFAWQDRYFFENTVHLPKGTKPDGEVGWDNSDRNPKNPSRPPIQVNWGEQTKDEMGAVTPQVYAAAESDLPSRCGAHIGSTSERLPGNGSCKTRVCW